MRTIHDESALVPPDLGRKDYIRSKLDPTVLICSRTGETFTRRDGARWEFAAYRQERERDESVTMTHPTAYCDHERYRPADATDSAFAA